MAGKLCIFSDFWYTLVTLHSSDSTQPSSNFQTPKFPPTVNLSKYNVNLINKKLVKSVVIVQFYSAGLDKFFKLRQSCGPVYAL